MRVGVAWLVGVCLVAVACGHEPTTARNVVLITIDTLRADRLGMYGATVGTSPHIDALAHEATVFDAAIATCPATAPSVASIMTGNHRATHRVLGNGWTLPADVETLAERFHAQGYRTVARIANTAVDANAGFAQGFDDFVMPAGLERAGPGMLEGEPLVADVERVAATLGEGPWFLWIHLMDPHGPYFPAAAYRDRFAAAAYKWPGDPDALPIGASNFGLGIIPAYQNVANETSPAAYRARYDAEVAAVDARVGELVEILRRHGLWDRALFVLTADHGESLGEHGYYFAHGWFVSDESVRVPLLVHGPGVPAGRRVAENVSSIDIAPTLLDLMSLPPSTTMEGRSLRPLLGGGGEGGEAFSQTYYGEGLVAYRSGKLKYVFKPPHQPGARPGSDPPFPDAAGEWLYDLATDPAEANSLIETRTAEATRMRARLQEWLRGQEARGRTKSAEQPRAGSTPIRVQGDPQLERQLRALGYLD